MKEIHATSLNFNSEVIEAKQPVLIDFWAPWCGPCKMLAPVINEIADAYENQVKVVKVNVDEEMELANQYHISGIPTLLMFDKGTMINKLVGYHSKNEIEKLIPKGEQ